MSDTLRKELVDFYTQQKLPKETAARLRALAQVDGSPSLHSTRSWIRRRGLLATAAALLLCGLAFYAGLRVGQEQQLADNGVGRADLVMPGEGRLVAGVEEGATQAAGEGTPDEAPEQTIAQLASAEWPNLVAVRIHADWCPACPEIARQFADLLETYGNEPVLFVTLDITNRQRVLQSRLLADSLHVRDVLGPKWAPGRIQLIDRSRSEVIATLTDQHGRPEWERALAHALPRPDQP